MLRYIPVRLIIPAAGFGFRWGYYWPDRKEHQARGWHKHLAEINGEAILHRLVRLFQEAGVDDIWVVSRLPDMLSVPGTEHYTPAITPENGDADKFINSQDLWAEHGRTVLIYGDVYITPEVVDTIVKDAEPFTAYGRTDSSPVTGRGQGWIGIAFEPERQDVVKFYSALLAFYRKWRALERNGTWELLHAMSTNGSLPNSGFQIAEALTKPLDDITMDVDSPEEYEALKAIVENA